MDMRIDYRRRLRTVRRHRDTGPGDQEIAAR
jgi:hypothetical protein